MTDAITATSAGGANFLTKIKDGIFWMGRGIKTGFVKLGKAMKAAWDKAAPFIKDVAIKFAKFMRTAPGLAAGGLVLGITLWSVSKNRNVVLGTLLKIASIACFVGGGFAVGLGFTKGWKTQII